mmetsp:Transcript_78121/g.203554  ORF Transcript_78121/g.203554 Transcript_78121/m.203554 type:complete len:80 (-) Transcript_78121:158-397(-)
MRACGQNQCDVQPSCCETGCSQARQHAASNHLLERHSRSMHVFFFIPQIQHEPSEDAAQQGRSKQTIGALIVVAAASGF